MTALYDAIGETITEYKEEMYNICVIITDGEENSSRKFTHKTAMELVKEVTDKKEWIFHYLGANQDAFAVGGNIGVKNTTNWVQNEEGTKAMFLANQSCVKGYRAQQVRKKKGMF